MHHELITNIIRLINMLRYPLTSSRQNLPEASLNTSFILAFEIIKQILLKGDFT